MSDPSSLEKSRDFSILYSRGNIGAKFSYTVMGLFPLCPHELHTAEEATQRCFENIQQIYRTSMPKCDFNKVAKQLYRNSTSAWVFSVNLLHQNTFS